MASVYFRIKVGGTWRYRAIGRGRPPKGAKFHVRYTDARKKQTWSNPYDTVEEAQDAAANIGTILNAQARGLTIRVAGLALLRCGCALTGWAIEIGTSVAYFVWITAKS